ncbi:MAG: hypothetical protein IRZ07_21040 [Microbispora sp.]|nr:hypothetical protein [Microbispora sp.]
MIGYHGSDTQITTIHGGTGAGIYLATNADDAACYGPIVHTITIADTANIADYRDVMEAVEAVREIGNFDPAGYSTWALLEMNEVRDYLAAAGFDGAEVDDTTPDGDPHDAILIWNTDLLTITSITEVAA